MTISRSGPTAQPKPAAQARIALSGAFKIAIASALTNHRIRGRYSLRGEGNPWTATGSFASAEERGRVISCRVAGGFFQVTNGHKALRRALDVLRQHGQSWQPRASWPEAWSRPGFNGHQQRRYYRQRLPQLPIRLRAWLQSSMATLSKYMASASAFWI